MGPSLFGLDGNQLESIDCLLVLVSLPASSDIIGQAPRITFRTICCLVLDIWTIINLIKIAFARPRSGSSDLIDYHLQGFL